MTDQNKPLLSADKRKALYDKLRDVWNLGENVVIGWRSAATGVEILFLTSTGMTRVGRDEPGMLERNRHIREPEKFEALIAKGCQSVVLQLPFAVAEDKATIEEMNAILRYYTVTHSQCRAVGLFDIVNFSLYSAFEQITQINVLAHHINQAAAHVGAVGLPIDVTASTTGDGFYIWNRKEGLAEDLALFYATSLALIYNQRAREENPHETIPILRCCLDFGDHYEYYQASGTKPDPRGFIVGDVTIRLARLISKALPRQFIVGSYIQEIAKQGAQEPEATAISRIDTPSFVNFASSNSKIFLGSAFAISTVERIGARLTGDQISENEHTINKYEMTDKHGLSHRCFNANFDLTDATGRKVSVGLPNDDLERFDVDHVKRESIRLKVV